MKQDIESKIVLPDGVSIEASGSTITLRSKNGEASKEAPGEVEIEIAGNLVVLRAKNATKRVLSKMNSLESHLRNIAECLRRGYRCELAIVYAHFPMTLSQKGNFIEISNFGGEKKARRASIVKGVTVEIKGKEIFVKGYDKEAVSQTAANLEQATRKVGKDTRRFQDGIYVVRKGHLE